jgi:hypothetical protein
MSLIIITYLLLSQGLGWGVGVTNYNNGIIPNACLVKDDPRFPQDYDKCKGQTTTTTDLTPVLER